ncbi:MAG: thiamine pyrophosphate-binding protein [Promethearchaeota archaeon]|jgi:acetolactate synthase-1/2/3 large subunit
MAEKKTIINGGDVLIKCLLEEDVKYMFGIPGGQLLSMYDAVYRWGREKGIDTVMFRHEQAAAHAADAWARITNTPGVCFGTVGPGATHLVPGIAAAWSDNIPVIAIAPQVNLDFEDDFTLQGNLDQVSLFKPITKYQSSVRELKKIPEAVQKIFREATGGRPQPVFLEIFPNALTERINEEEISILPAEQYRALYKPAISNKLIKQSLDLLINAKKPLVVSGGGVMRAEGWHELKEFAEYLQIPVITTIMGIGTMESSSKCHLGVSMTSVGFQASSQADVVLALGCKFGFSLGHGRVPAWSKSQKVIQIDIDPSIIGRSKPISLGIEGDCKMFLTQILEEAKKNNPIKKSEWLDSLSEKKRSIIESRIKVSSSDEIPIDPKRMIKEVFQFMDEDAIMIVDAGNMAFFAIEQIDFYKPRKPLSTLQAIGMGHLGTSVPYGIAAKLAKPDKQVISISGDGAFMINIQDLETAVRLGLKNLIYVIGNNSAWGMIKVGQEFGYQRRFIDTDFPDFNFAACAEGFGCFGEVVTDPNELKPALERAKNSNKPAVIDVKIKYATPDLLLLIGSLGIYFD